MASVLCPFCHNETRVIDSRPAPDSSLRRRRECNSCGARFTTYERFERRLLVRKKDGARQPFSREKLKKGIIKACEKRPVGMDAIERLCTDVEKALVKDGNETTTKRIGELVMRKLKRLDQVAYIRFASVYREFTDLESFEDELKRLKEK